MHFEVVACRSATIISALNTEKITFSLENDIKMTKPIDAYDIPEVVNRTQNFFGLAAIVRENGDLKWKFSVTKWALRIIISTMSNSLFVYGKVVAHNILRRKFHFGDLGQMLFLIGYIYYVIDLIIVYKSGIDRVRYYKIHNYVDDIIGKGFYSETKAEITKMYIGFVSFFILSYLNNFVIKAIYEESVFAIILNFLDLYNSFFILVSLLDQISTITQLKNRLKHMGDVLEAYANCRYTMPGSFEEEIPSEKFKSSRTMMKKKLNSLKCLKDCRYFEILWFKKCYLMMLEQVDYINTLFGLKVKKNFIMKIKLFIY